jgi:hypothetical protein
MHVEDGLQGFRRLASRPGIPAETFDNDPAGVPVTLTLASRLQLAVYRSRRLG